MRRLPALRPGRQPIQPGFSWHNFFGLFFGTKKIQAEKVAQLFQANDAPAAGLEAGWPAGRHGGARVARANRIQVRQYYYNRFAGDNRLLNSKSSYLRILLAPPCRLIICWFLLLELGIVGIE